MHDDSHNLTPAELAQRWRCSRGWLANLRCRGEGPAYVKLGARVLYRQHDVAAYEAASLVGATA